MRHKNILKNSVISGSLLAFTFLLGAPIASYAQGDINLWPKLADAGLKDQKTEAKIDAILAKMTLEEKVGQTIQADIAFIKPEDLKIYPLGSILAGGNSSPGGNERANAAEWLKLADDFWKASDARPTKVKIPLLFGIDAVHGHSNLIGAVIFPHNIGLGSARNPELIKKIGEVTAKEMSIVGVDWTFAPTVATPQDERWGRTYEGYSENPDVVASYAGKVVEGLQGKNGGRDGIKPGHIMATAKHFLGDGGTKSGVDQGDTEIDEATLVKVHNGGYPPSINAGALSVMASFSSWNGAKTTGSKYLLTDVLKGQMGFDGFVVSDWNAQGQIPGCTNYSCPQALNAGIDMYMAPDSWKKLYENTLTQVKSGEIPMARLDDAVRRILRAKLKGGLFEMGAPSTRPLAGKFNELGDKSSREIARQAVRESLVLLKNNNSLLPIKAGANVLVAGDGADNIGKQSGGWTITWQGTGNANSDFPNGQSIYSGIKDAVEKSGGKATLSVDGKFTKKPDVAIVVIGEDPYAEFQGDRPNLAYKPDDTRDLQLLKKLKSQKIPVVTVFLSGRPLFVNPELNQSDAFVAAFLPGSEGGGIADVIIGDKAKKPRFDFTGKLSFSWPRRANQYDLNIIDKPYDPLFAYGYGLNFKTKKQIPILSEDSGLANNNIVNTDNYFTKGRTRAPWSIYLTDNGGSVKIDGNGKSPSGAITQTTIDTTGQESGRQLVFKGVSGSNMRLEGERVNLSRQTTGDMVIRIHYRLDTPVNGAVLLGMGRDPFVKQQGDISAFLKRAKIGEWAYLNVRLSCFKEIGTDMTQVAMPFYLGTDAPLSISYDEISLKSNDSGDAVCPN
jgi:beta-glucosidase